jgi:hypothetical protein
MVVVFECANTREKPDTLSKTREHGKSHTKQAGLDFF